MHMSGPFKTLENHLLIHEKYFQDYKQTAAKFSFLPQPRIKLFDFQYLPPVHNVNRPFPNYAVIVMQEQ